MKRNCPNLDCKFHKKSKFVVRDGRYFRKNDSKWIPRFKCQHCGKRFSSATTSAYYRQKKRRVIPHIRKLLASKVSMRRIAILLKIHLVTVARKLDFLAKQACLSKELFLKKLQNSKVKKVQFDDLITIEHTKMKPLTVTIAVDKETRLILGAEVGKIPAFGHLAEKSRRKYGPRPNEHKETLHRLFKKIHKSIDPKATFESDEHSFYPAILKKYFPGAIHHQFKSERGCVAGQGELKKVHFDPLFCINHTCAMLRDNLNRLIRRTWCSTKRPDRLQSHLDIFIDYYNHQLLNLKSTNN